jgi:hypothetical protein
MFLSPPVSAAFRRQTIGFMPMMNFLRTLFGGGQDTPLDNDLVATILDNLKLEPSEELREMLAQSSSGKWSPEALEAAHLLLDQRLKKIAPEPVHRTTPRAELVQMLREKEAVASGFSRELLALDVGSRLHCRRRGEHGTIIRWDDQKERFYVRYDNGDGEWSTLTQVGVPLW